MFVRGVSFLLSVSALLAPAVGLRRGDCLGALCSHKQTELTRMSQIVRLKAELNSKAALECTENVRSAISDLVDLFPKDNENVCTADKITQFRKFYLDYVETAGLRREPLPGPLRTFVLAYGMQVANVCKKQMVDNLLVQEAVGAKHFKWLDERVQARAALNSIIEDVDLLLPGDMTRGLFQKSRGSNKLKIPLQTSPDHVLPKIKAKCRSIFEPVYRPVIMPYAFLYNSGFGYRDEELEAKLNDDDFRRELKRWNRITFLCELLNLLEIIESPWGMESKLLQDHFIKFLTTAEAEELKKQFGLEGSQVEREPKATVSYKLNPPLVLSDLVVAQDNKPLMEAIRSFKTHEIELEKIKGQLMARGVRIVMGAIKVRKWNIKFSSKVRRLSLEQAGGVVSRNLSESDQIVVAIRRLSNSGDAPLVVGMIFKELLTSLGIVGISVAFAIMLILCIIIPALFLG